MSFEILERYTRAVLFTSATAPDLKAAVIEAVGSWADLRGADLRGANLRWANGLLRGGIIPLQILGTRDYLIVRSAGHITIGCEHHPIKWWEQNYAAIGKNNNYSEAEITEYHAHIQHAKRWMESKGVLVAAVEPVPTQEGVMS